MFGRSLRLFSGDWMKFFSSTRRFEPDLYRGTKEIGDFSKFVTFLEDHIYSNFSEVRTGDVLKIASIHGHLTKLAKKSHKRDTRIFNEIIEILIFKVEKDQSIEWITKNIQNFFVFLRDHPNFKENFNENTIKKVLDEGLGKLDEFLLHELASFTYSVSLLFPEHSQKTWDALQTKFLNQETFAFFPLACLVPIFSGIFSSKNSKNIEKMIQNEKFFEFFEELLEKIGRGNFHDLVDSEILHVLKNVPPKISKKLTNVIAEKLYKEILNIRDHSEYFRYDNIIDILTSIGYLQSDHYKKELFMALNNKVLLGIISKDNNITTCYTDYLRSLYLKNFLNISKSLNLYHVALIDHIVMCLDRETNSKFFRQNPGIFSECISSLAYLNYPGRFTDKIPHKEHHWEIWDEFIKKTEDFLFSAVVALQQKELDVHYESTYSQKNINFLWSLCVLNKHSAPILQTLLDPYSISTDEEYDEETMSKLFQVHYWLLYENNAVFQLNPALLEKMNSFKENCDKRERNSVNTNNLKNAVRGYLIENSIPFKENHSDFPYCFDFVNLEKKSGILIDDDSKFLQETNMEIRNGFFKVMNRQLVLLGWGIQKISLSTLMSLNLSEI